MCHSNKTRASIANPPNTAQLEGTLTIPPSYIRVRAIVWECGEEQKDTDRQTQTHYTFRLDFLTRNVIKITLY